MFLLGCRFQGGRGREEMVQDVRGPTPQPEPKPAEDENKKLPTVCDPAELRRSSCQGPGLGLDQIISLVYSVGISSESVSGGVG